MSLLNFPITITQTIRSTIGANPQHTKSEKSLHKNTHLTPTGNEHHTLKESHWENDLLR